MKSWSTFIINLEWCKEDAQTGFFNSKIGKTGLEFLGQAIKPCIKSVSPACFLFARTLSGAGKLDASFRPSCICHNRSLF